HGARQLRIARDLECAHPRERADADAAERRVVRYGQLPELAQAPEIDGFECRIVADHHQLSQRQTRGDGDAAETGVVADVDHIQAQVDGHAVRLTLIAL